MKDMKDKRDAFSIGYSNTLSIRGKVLNQEENKDILLSMEIISTYANPLLQLLLTLGNKPYTLDKVYHSGEEVTKDLGKLHKESKSSLTFKKFVEASEAFYHAYCYRSKPDEKGTVKLRSNAREFANSLFNPSSSLKIPKPVRFLRKCGILPIIVDKKPIGVNLRFCANQQVLMKLTSMEEIQRQYDQNKLCWESVVNESISNLTKIDRYNDMLMSIKKIPELSGFKIDNYKKLLCRWRGPKNDETGKRDKEKGMRSFFIKTYEKNPQMVFNEEHRYLFGYSPDFMNLIFNDYRDLWLEEDIIGSQRSEEPFGKKDYVDIVIDSFHWLKESINISSFGKYCPIILGKNYVPFKLVKDEAENRWSVEAKNISGAKDNKSFKICHCPQFDTLSISKVHSLKRNGLGEKKETTKFRYSGDSKSETWYEGEVSEITLGYRKDNKSLYVYFPLTNHMTEGTVASKLFDDIVTDSDIVKSIFPIRTYYQTASPTTERQKVKDKLPLENMVCVGYDMGLRKPYQGQVARVFTKNGKVVIEEIDKIDSFVNPNGYEKQIQIDCIGNEIFATKLLLRYSVLYVSGQIEVVPSSVFNKYQTTNFESVLGINIKEYNKYLEPYRLMKDKSVAFKELRKKKNKWIIGFFVKKFLKEVSDLRMEFARSLDKRDYCKNHNYVDYSVFRKKEVIQSLMTLLKAFSTFGMTSKECQHFTSNFSHSLRKWYKGLTRRCSSIASSMVNAARKHNALVIFIEDLDSHPSLFDSSDKNSLKRLWGWGEIKKWMAHEARKHGIIVIQVDPHLTSRINADDGLLGLTIGRNLYTFLPNGDINIVDRDENAARSILKRGILRHSDIREFPVESIGNNKYRLLISKIGSKRKTGAIFKHIGSTNVIFFKDEKNNLKYTTIISPEDIQAVADGKDKVILHGDTWKLRSELDIELENKMNEYMNNLSLLQDKSKIKFRSENVKSRLTMCEPIVTI